jgi:hypothetical protein
LGLCSRSSLRIYDESNLVGVILCHHRREAVISIS